MANYKITFSLRAIVTADIVANSEDEAEALAKKLEYDDVYWHFDDDNFVILSIEEEK